LEGLRGVKLVDAKRWPTADDWSKLATVLGMIEWIVEDSLYVREVPRQVTGTGLLGSANLPPSQIEPAREESRRSKLKNWPPGAPYDALVELLRILPGIDDIGGNPADRATILHKRIMQMPAAAWLLKQEAFKKSLKTARSVHKPNRTNEEKIWLEFRLLRAIRTPLFEYQVLTAGGVEPAYPTSEKLSSAAGHARQLQTFLRQNYGLFTGSEGLPWKLNQEAEHLASRLSALATNYQKPRSDSPLLQRQYMEAVSLALKEQFGTCSATVLQHLCALVDYEPGGITRLAQRRASSVNLGSKTGRNRA
jgi:hypothetical protein